MQNYQVYNRFFTVEEVIIKAPLCLFVLSQWVEASLQDHSSAQTGDREGERRHDHGQGQETDSRPRPGLLQVLVGRCWDLSELQGLGNKDEENRGPNEANKIFLLSTSV